MLIMHAFTPSSRSCLEVVLPVALSTQKPVIVRS